MLSERASRTRTDSRCESIKPAVAALTALTAFMLVAALDEPTPLDRALYRLAAQLADRRLELAQRPLELLGLPGAYIPVAHLLARALRRNGKRGGNEVIVAAWAGWLALRAMRLMIHRPRPPRPPGRGPKRESTFPSGHSTGLTALSIVLAEVLAREGLLTRRQARTLGIGVPLAIGANRVYVREHWLTDVLGGWTLGASVAAGALAVVRRGPRRQTRAASRST